jgi:hypothetical protein
LRGVARRALIVSGILACARPASHPDTAETPAENRLKRAWIASLLLAVVLAGCGGSSTHKGKTTASGASAATGPLASTTPGAGSTDCNALGINPIGMREGTCTHAGVTWVIVDEDHTLKLKTLWARLAGVRTAKSLTSTTAASTANGAFVIVSVAITNKLQLPQMFDARGAQQAGLILDGTVFKEAVAAESQADVSSCLKLATPLAPGQSETCDVIFDVPAHAAADLGKHGSGDLYLVNFGADLGGSVLPQKIGQIRLYH